MAGPLDQLVERILRRVEAFKSEQSLEEVEVSIELADGALHRLQTISSEPGYGFVSFRPHGDEPSELIVPLGSIREIRVEVPGGQRVLGFAGSPSEGD